MSTSKLSVYQNAIKNEDSKALLERLYAANPTAGSFYDLDVAAADAAHTSGKEQLDTNLATSKAALEKNKTAQKRAASYSYAKLLNYLPEQLKAQGLHGQGVSQSALLGAYGNYRNAVAGVDADYADRVSALEKAYKTDLAGLDATRDNAYHTVLQNYMTRVDNTESRSALNEKIMEELETKFAEAEATGDWTEARKYLDTAKGFIDENTLAFLSTKVPEMVGAAEVENQNPTEDATVHKFLFDYNADRVGMDQIKLSPGGEILTPKASITEDEGRSISEGLDVRVDSEQAKAVQAVLSQSASWGTDKNGTLVRFNVGAVYDDAHVYMFYNGRWIKTNLGKHASGVVDAKEYLEK